MNNFYKVALASIAFVATPPVLAQDVDEAEIKDVWERGCGDDQGNDRCADDTREKMLGLYGLESAEALAERNVALLRAMMVDGYGNDTVAVTFMRAPGQSPFVDVRAPSTAPEEEQLLRSPISVEDWRTIWAASSNFDRVMASEELPDGAPMSICFHGWVAVVEAVRPGSPHVSTSTKFKDGQRVSETEIVRPPASVQRDTESACADGLAVPFAFEMANTARKLLGECSGLDIDDFRSSPELLALCHRLRGDRHAAVDAYDAIKKLESDLRMEGEEFDWNFVSMDEDEAKRFKREIEGAAIFFGAPTAHSPTDATVEAHLFYTTDKKAGLPEQMATMTIHLYWYANGFDVLSWKISERRPFKMPPGN